MDRYKVPTGEDFTLPATWKPIPKEEMDRRVKELNQKVADNVERIQSSAEFRNFLITMARFHTYSFNNTMLIMIQKPEATHVAGFNTWKSLGRQVKYGETGISILAPRGTSGGVTWRRVTDGASFYLRRVEGGWSIFDANNNEVKTFRTRGAAVEELKKWAVEERFTLDVSSYKTVAVFDISQTVGKPLPEFEVPTLTGEANQELLDGLLSLAKEQGVTVSFEPRPHQDPGIKGQFSRPNQIWVRPEEPPAQQLKTLLHEFAHYYSASVFQIPRQDAETIAESSAYIVGAHYSFDTGVRSFPYVALWSKDIKVFKANMHDVQEVAEKIIDALEQRKARLMPQVRRRSDYVPASYPTLLAEVEATHSIEELKRMAQSKRLPSDGSKRQIANDLIKAGAFPRAVTRQG